MSTKLKTITGEKEEQVKELYLTRFYGGDRRGVCVQITLDNDYIQLDKESVKELIKTLRAALS